jgi:hypothetical protein
MAFFGLRKWSTPVSQNIFDCGVAMYCSSGCLVADGWLGIVMAHSALTLTQVFRPLWPFFAASGITYFLISKAQDIGVRCALSHLFEKLSQLTLLLFAPLFGRIYVFFSRGIPQ